MVNLNDTPLNSDVIDHWGFGISDGKTHKSLDENNYPIKRVVLSTSSFYFFTHIGYYASQRMRGGSRTFFETDFHSLGVEGLPLKDK